MDSRTVEQGTRFRGPENMGDMGDSEMENSMVGSQIGQGLRAEQRSTPKRSNSPQSRVRAESEDLVEAYPKNKPQGFLLVSLLVASSIPCRFEGFLNEATRTTVRSVGF